MPLSIPETWTKPLVTRSITVFTFRRADSLMKKLKEMQQKENEETVALEKMVHMVEKNLELTTVRILFKKILKRIRKQNTFGCIC